MKFCFCGVRYASQRSIAQSGRALRSGRRGRRFESCYSDQKSNRHIAGFIFGRIDNWIWYIVIASAMAGSKTSRFDKRSAIKSLRFPRSVGIADRGNPGTRQIFDVMCGTNTKNQTGMPPVLFFDLILVLICFTIKAGYCYVNACFFTFL